MSANHTLQILVVDDDPIFTEAAAACLGGPGSSVCAVDNGMDALSELEARRFDLALLDLSMPRIDGLRLMAIIRSTPKIKDLCIVVVTSRSDKQAMEEATRLGAAAYFSKPVKWGDLRARVYQLMTDATAA